MNINWPLPPITILLILLVIAGMVYATITPIEEENPELAQSEYDQLNQQTVYSDSLPLSDVDPIQMNPADDLDSANEVTEELVVEEKVDSLKKEEPAAPEGINYQYIVQAGDSFLGIAKRFGYGFDELQKANPDVRPSNILVGVTKIKVKVKAVHIVGPGDILGKISEKYKVSKEVLMRANSKKQDIALRGEEIIIPIK
jgi:LysM repeat protein